ncbi:uncharacterized protein JN550_012269 [Neoarthrinium moseri]|uniref:uncharacterized protein n=1 Tax=Neoarthrinium moseri TaxID=1658444 RepID=UPI001FDB2EEE|nr:uncharacterized protein JN550_012269 [Neoarthrinium moseri]KAI1859007.1 hypothetical protein JN550_012269 [Neoarthrinium moseri]
MENDASGGRRGRLMGKLFNNKEKASKKDREQFKAEQSANDLSAFLGGGNADKLQVTHPPPPPPAHGHREYDRQQPQLALDTSRATRYPQALDVDNGSQQNLAYRSRSHSPPGRPRRKNKGLVVRFVDSYPEVIGVGGDECDSPVAEIGRRKRSRSAPLSAPIPPTKQGHEYARQVGAYQEVTPPQDDDGFIPGPIRRTQTGYVPNMTEEAGPAPNASSKVPSPQPRTVPAGETARSRFLDTSSRKDEARRSFIEIHQHEQRQAEGMAFAEAMRSAGAESHNEWDDHNSSPEPVRSTPQTMQQRNVPAVAMNDAPFDPPFDDAIAPSSSPFRAQSTRKPMPQAFRHEDRPPMRAQSTRTHVQPLMPDPTQPQQPPQLPPPKNPARRSPLPPTIDPSSRVLLPPMEAGEETPPSFTNDVLQAGRPTDLDELRMKTRVESDSPSSQYSGSIYSTSELSQKATPIAQSSQNPRDRSWSTASPEKAPRKPSDLPGNDDAYEEFIRRTKHLYELFRLHAEQFKPLGSCKPDDMCRAAVWWFLKGRTALETTMRSRGTDLDETKSLMNRYQAYTDLTKGYWLTELALPEIAEGKYSPVDGELGDVRQILTTNLKKLAGSMSRNGLLPPDEPFMPQMMDKGIWVDYPTLSQDIISLLNGNWGSLLLASASQANSHVHALEALPLGDTPQIFNYGRVNADVYLMEQGMESMHTYFPCILSINRPVNTSSLVFTVASQNGSVTLQIQSDKSKGPSWDGVRWRTDKCSLELKMPRGFIVAIQCSQTDFRMLWNIFDFNAKVQSYLYPSKEESVTFQTKLRGFHYFDADPNSRVFPKEPVGQCEVALFERLLKEGSPTGPRTFHRGFRLAVVTGPRTRTLSGVTHFYTPQMPIQFSYLRGEQREPMLQLAYGDAKTRCRMVLIFSDDNEREKLLTLLKGSYVHGDEEVITEVPLQGFSMSEGLQDTKGGLQTLQRLPWQRARIVNDKYTENPPVVLAEKLRLELISLDQKGNPVGTITDRVNMAPGEFKIRLGTKDILTLQAIRNPQVDMTISIMDRPGASDARREFTSLQETIARTQTVRTYRFNNFKDLHAFQAGITGYAVLFDGVASSLNITRRRMVVPVHKKWESGTARIQVVQHNADKTVQLLAFFENWHHGQCMGFVLKGTDVFESTGKMGKAVVKFVEAKFPLPRVSRDENSEGNDDMAFVSLDMPDYAGEHDDISIVFEDEAERDKLCACLPAPVKGSRLSKIGR